MDIKIKVLVELLDEALSVAEARLGAKRAGADDPALEAAWEQIISALR